MPHSYLGRNALKPFLGDTTTKNDVAYRRALEGVSQEIDKWTNRTFRTSVETRYFTPEDGDEILIDDVVSVTAVRMDQDGDRTYETTLSTSDWELLPFNATSSSEPYTILSRRPNGSYSFTSMRRGLQIVGTWGYWEDLANSTSKCSTNTDATSTSFGIAGSTSLDVGQTIRIDDEDMYVNDIDTSSNVFVERGINGSTASTHSTSSPIKVHRYPPTVVEACRIQATRIFKRKDAPFGSFAGPTDMIENVVEVSRLDPDVEQLLKTYHRKRWLGV